MITIYRIYHKIWFLNILAICMLLFTLQLTIFGIRSIVEHGVAGFWSNTGFIGAILFLLILICDIWLLTATFLPIIKISDAGIFAYSIFWRRKIKWSEIKSAKLLKMKNGRSGGRAFVSFERAQEPETKSNAFLNKGVRVATFIVVSKTAFKQPKALSLSGGLLTHNKMTTKEEIAFEYDAAAWEIIKDKSGKH